MSGNKAEFLADLQNRLVDCELNKLEILLINKAFNDHGNEGFRDKILEILTKLETRNVEE